MGLGVFCLELFSDFFRDLKNDSVLFLIFYVLVDSNF